MAAVIIVPIIAIWALCSLLYLPPVQEYATHKIEEAVARNSEFRLSVGRIGLTFPFNLAIEDFELTKEQRLVTRGKALEININPLPLLRGEVEVNYILLEQIKIDTHDLIESTHIAGEIGYFRSAIRNIDLIREQAEIKQLHIEEADVKIAIGESKESDDEPAAPVNWEILLRKGNIKNSHITIQLPEDSTTIGTDIGKLAARNLQAHLADNSYKLEQLDITHSGVTYDHGTQPREEAPLNHITIEDIHIAGRDIAYSPATLEANIDALALRQPDGIDIKRGSLAIEADSTLIKIEEATLNSANGSYINVTATIAQAIFSGNSYSPVRANLAAHIDKRDLKGLITAEQAELLSTLPDSMIDARLSLHGSMERAVIDTVCIAIPAIATMSAKGRLANIGSNKQGADIDLAGTIFNVEPFTGSTTTTPLSLNGNAKARGSLYSANIDINGNGGGNILAFYDTKSEIYNAKIDLKQFDLEASIGAVPVKNLSMRASLSGAGTDIYAPATYYQLFAAIDTLQYSNFIATGTTVSAFQANSFSFISLISNSPHSNLELTAKTHIRPTDISNSTKLKIENLAFDKTGISDKNISGKIDLEFEARTDLDETHSLKLRGSDIALNTPIKKFTPADINIDIATAPDSSHISATNGDLSIYGTLASGYNQLLTQIAKIEDMFLEARYSEKSIYYAHDFERLLPAMNLNFECGKQNMLHNFMAMNSIDLGDIELKCSIDSTEGIRARGAVYDLTTNEAKLDTIRFSAMQEGENIKYFAGVRSSAITPDKKKQSFSAALFGNLLRDTLNTNFSFRGNDRSSDTRIGTSTLLMPEGLNIHILPKAKVLGEVFEINGDNYISIGKNEVISADIHATDQYDAGLHLYATNDSTAKHDISLSLFNINLGKLTASLPFTPDITGTLNSDIRLRNESDGLVLNGDIYGDSIAYEGNYIGNESADFVYLPKQNDRHIASLLLCHNGNEYLDIEGDYDNGNINGRAILTKLPLRVINSFIKESNLNIDGYIDGNVTLDGPLETANSNGYIQFDSVYVDAPMLGSQMRLVNDKVNIEESKIKFNDFKIYAKGNTPFKVNGDIDVSHFAQPTFDLRMQASNYELINAERQRNSLIYGKLFLDINSYITGAIQALKVYGNATVLGNTNVTYVMPESSIATNNELDGLVEFVNFQDSTKTTHNEESPDLGNITMSMTLNIEEGAWINADFDSSRQSYINLQGGGQLNMSYTSEAGISLTGRYTLNNGEMKYNLPIIPLKTFSISQGSYVNWTGDLMNPTLNITALERIVAPVSIDGGNNQPVAFDVGLVLSNSLDNMGLSFTIKAPENAAIQDELNSLDAETLNKYAVTMLITGAYMGSNGGLTVSNALTSFLDAKINDLAGDAMKSVSINVGITDVENKETGGSYTNYSFSFAKRFWNDRLTIVVGGEVNSGDNPEEENSFINNVSLEWRLTADGNRYLRLFYDKNYESILEGEITETGVGYVYRRKLNNLSELLFIKPRNKEEPHQNIKTQEQ